MCFDESAAVVTRSLRNVFWIFVSKMFSELFFPYILYDVFPYAFLRCSQVFFQMFLNRPADVFRHSKQQLARWTSASPRRSDPDNGDTLPFYDTVIL